MTDYNLPFNGNEVRDGLTRVVSPDLSPQSPSTKMVTSEGIKTALDAKLDASVLVTNLNSPNNTTVPTTQVVSNHIPNRPWYAAYKGFSNITSEVAITGWDEYSQGGIGIGEDSGGGFPLPTGHYQVGLCLMTGQNIGVKLGYTPSGGSYEQIGTLEWAYNGDGGSTSIIQIRNTGTLYVRAHRVYQGPGSGTATGYGSLTLTITKLTDS